MKTDTNFIKQVEQFIFDTESKLPLQIGEIAEKLTSASNLLERFYDSESASSARIPEAILELSKLHGSLAILLRHATEQDAKATERRRTFTQSEEFTIRSLEKSLEGYKERLKNADSPMLRTRLEGCLNATQGRLSSIVMGNVSARDKIIRKQQFQQELRQLNSKFARTGDPEQGQVILKRKAEVELALSE